MMAYFRNLVSANAEIDRLRDARMADSREWFQQESRIETLRAALEKIARETTDAQIRADATAALRFAAEENA